MLQGPVQFRTGTSSACSSSGNQSALKNPEKKKIVRNESTGQVAGTFIPLHTTEPELRTRVPRHCTVYCGICTLL